jgi:hypothetical protein
MEFLGELVQPRLALVSLALTLVGGLLAAVMARGIP